jgi:hypothetical protein
MKPLTPFLSDLQLPPLAMLDQLFNPLPYQIMWNTNLNKHRRKLQKKSKRYTLCASTGSVLKICHLISTGLE